MQSLGLLYLGVDIGRTKDLTVMDVGELIGDVLWDRFRLELRNKTFAEQEYELAQDFSTTQIKTRLH